ncbi:MAG: PEP-CTERM sorting domain-containing protein [Candidatus Acidiferrales bacterium]
MKSVRVCLMAVAVALCALVLSPGMTRADTLTGSTGITWVFGTATFATDTIVDGSSLSCPGASPICAGYSGYGSETFSVGTSSISYSVSNFPVGNYGGTINGFDFTGLTFTSGDSLTGFTIASNSIGLTDADITIGPSSIFINLAGLPIDGSFTLDLTSGPSVSTPEPSSLLLLGIGLLALAGLTRKRLGSARRFAVESAH